MNLLTRTGKYTGNSIEFAPRDEVLEWAKSLAISERFENHKVFVLTHSFCVGMDLLSKKESYGVSPANYGKVIWEKLLYPCKNILYAHMWSLLLYRGVCI